MFCLLSINSLGAMDNIIDRVFENELLENDGVHSFNNLVSVAANLSLPIFSNKVDTLLKFRGIGSPRNQDYFEKTVPLYSISDFKSHFRMSPTAMEVVIQNVGMRLVQSKHSAAISIEKKCHFTMWMLSKPETFLAGGDRFNFSRSTAHKVFEEIVGALTQCIDQYILWPNPTRQRQTCQVFQARSKGFPGIVGVIDATHIQIIQPIDNANDYYNRKQVHSVILQAVCDETCKFINIATGYPGRLHDARVYRNSALSDSLDALIEDEELHLIGDVAYPMSTKLLTPFRDNGHLTRNQKRYNRKLSAVRSTIERSFGRLKGKFRRLKLLESTKLKLISNTIVAICVLHNIIIDSDGLSDEEYPCDDGPDEEPLDEPTAPLNCKAGPKRRRISSIV